MREIPMGSSGPKQDPKPDPYQISPEISKQMTTIIEKLETVFKTVDSIEIINDLNRAIASTPPAVAPRLKEHLKSTKDEGSALDNFIRKTYGDKATEYPGFQIQVAAKMAYVANLSLRALMKSEQAGSNPDIEGHLQRLLAMQGIRDELSGDIMFGLQDFPKDIRERLKAEPQGKNPEGKNEFNAYCEFLGSDSKSALKEAIDIQKIKSPEERKSELSGKYKEHQPTRQKLG